MILFQIIFEREGWQSSPVEAEACGDSPQMRTEKMGDVQLRQAKRRTICALLFVFGFCCVFSGRGALSQVDQGAINGVVSDTQGAVIPGAEVTLTNLDTDFILHGRSNAVGIYSFSPIKIGHYKLSVTVPGFETTTQENITVNIQDRLDIDITLRPGAVQETVTVSTAPPMLQSETASVGQVMSTETINDTPLNGRNWIYVAQLAAGVAPSLANGTARGGGTGDFSANGQRTTQNNFILDGVDNNVNVDDFQNGASYNVRPPPDALAEFKIDTSNYNAEFGHSAGAVLSANIKSGTNQVHGDLWEYVRNTSLDSQDWDSTSVPTYHENQFGATLGGPIWKNKIFYFGDAEANRIAFAEPNPGMSVPTASMRNGDFSEAFNAALTPGGAPLGIFAPNTGGQIPLTQGGGAFRNPAANNPSLCQASNTPQLCAWNSATVGSGIGHVTTNVLTPGDPSAGGDMDKVAQYLFSLYPKPNAGGWTGSNYSTPGSGLLYNNYNVNLPVQDDTWQWDQRLDFNINTRDQTYARYSYTHEQVAFAPPLGPILDGGNEAPGGFHGSTNVNLAQNFMASETHVFNPSLVNEFRFGFNYGRFGFYQENANVPADQLVPGLGGVPFAGYPAPNGGLPWIVTNRGNLGISSAGARHDVPSIEHQNVYQILDNLTKVRGRHSLKFGVQLESIRTSFSQAEYPRGSYGYFGEFTEQFNSSGTNTSNTGIGMADAFTNNMGNVKLSPGWDTSYYRWYRSAYAQDDWKFNSRLTMNLGLRYDYAQPESSKPGYVANFVITSQKLVAPGTGANGQSATGTAEYVLPSKLQSQGLLAQSFLNQMASQNVTIDYTTDNPNSLVTVQKKNFAPRIGLSYLLGPKTVVRAGYGIFYGPLESPGGAELEQNYPFAWNAVLYNAYLGAGYCYPSIQGGYSNPKSTCPSTGTTDTANGSNLPYTATMETGMGNYLSHGGLGAYASQVGLASSDLNPKTPYTESYNLTIQRELSKNMVASLGYVGNEGKHTYAGTNPLSPIAVTSNANPNGNLGTSAFPDLYYNDAAQQYIGESLYNGLQANLEKRYAGGLSYLATYTWSHAEDNASNPGIGGGPGYRNSILIPLSYELTNANYDIRHRLTVNGKYDLPFGAGRKYLRSSGVLDYLVGGWSASLTWQAQTGNPFTVGLGNNFGSLAANGADQYNAIPVSDPFKAGGTPPAGNVDTTACPATVKNRTNWYNPCAFKDPAPGTNIPTSGTGAFLTNVESAIAYFGAKSNQIYGPGFERVNMSGFKNFRVWREQYLEFRADAFNLFNHPSWNFPADTSLNNTGRVIVAAQQFQNYTPDARFFQISGKYVF